MLSGVLPADELKSVARRVRRRGGHQARPQPGQGARRGRERRPAGPGVLRRAGVGHGRGHVRRSPRPTPATAAVLLDGRHPERHRPRSGDRRPPAPAALAVVGLGPGDPRWLVPEAARRARRRPPTWSATRPTWTWSRRRCVGGQRLHGSDNRGRARPGRPRPRPGGRRPPGGGGVVGRPGRVRHGRRRASRPSRRRRTRRRRGATSTCTSCPGITAALATAAEAGRAARPRLLPGLAVGQPQAVVDHRAAACGRPWRPTSSSPSTTRSPATGPRSWRAAFDLIREPPGPDTPIVLGRDVGRPGGTVTVVRLDELDLSVCDMRTVIIVGSTHHQARARASAAPRAYTPRSYPGAR